MNRYVPDAEDGYWRTLRSHGCDGKVSYPSKRIAKGVLRVMRARADSGTLGEYHCRVCHRWHLGNSRQRLSPIQDITIPLSPSTPMAVSDAQGEAKATPMQGVSPASVAE